MTIYKLDDTDELFEFLWLKPKNSNLNVDLFIDDGLSYKRHKHIILLFARNGYSKTNNTFIPFSIENQPNILDNDIDIILSNDDISNIKNFIIHNQNIITQLANKHISHTDFIKLLQI